MRRYDRLTLAVPIEEEDPVCAELWGHGSIGMECREQDGETVIEAYFETPLPRALNDLPAGWARRRIRRLGATGVPDEDWLATYRAVVKPFEVGRRWLIDPGEPDGPPPVASGRVTLRLPARRAFGTGSHESTRLILEWLEDLPIEGCRVLDLGTGSGVLSLAADHLGATAVVGIDLDPVAAIMARDNRRLNGGGFHIAAGSIDCLCDGRFDLALVNIVPAAWLAAIDVLAVLLAPGALSLFSGILLEQSEEFAAAVEPAGLTIEAARVAGEWVALQARRAGG